MKKWPKILGFSLLTLFILVLVAGLLLPNKYNVSRSIAIHASPQQIHDYVGNLKAWPTWTPWAMADPTLKVEYGDRVEGVGASQSWTGKEGRGTLKIHQSSPDTGIAYHLSFNEGKFECRAGINYEALEGDLTKVLWWMEGEVNTPILGTYMAMMIRTMSARMFDKGLEKLKAVVEGELPSI